MFPYLRIASLLFPGLVSAITDDRTVRNANQIKKLIDDTVRSISGGDTPEDAMKKVEADPKILDQLKIRLAEISLEAQRIETAEVAQFNRDANANTLNARETLIALLSKPDSLWVSVTPAIISYIVVFGFILLIMVMLFWPPKLADNQNVMQIINICVGAVAAGFATVLNFWLGSSLGSRRKDSAATMSSTVDKVKDLTAPEPPSGGSRPAPGDKPRPPAGGGQQSGGGGGDAPEAPDGNAGQGAGGGLVTPPVLPKVLPQALASVGRSTDPSTVNVRKDIPKGGASGPPASLRYRNPGAQYPSREAARFGQTGYGVIGGDHKIASFPSPINGAASNFDLLHRVYVGMTIGQAGKKWTGANGFGVPGYDSGRQLSRAMIEDAEQAIALLKAIAGRESGKSDALSADEWKHAHAMFRAGSADSYLSQFEGQALSAIEPVRPDDGPEEALESLIVQAMRSRNLSVDEGDGEINIVYVEGMNEDGSPNNDEANKFNDLRCVIGFRNGNPVMLGKWQATTEPGYFYGRDNPVNRDGAARIKFGQYTAWAVGIHRRKHEGLVQTGGEVTVCRDLNRDMERTGDTLDTGFFGINQHGGYDQSADDIGKASAGCLVGRLMSGHSAFMEIVKSDPRYRADKKYAFKTTILPAAEVTGGASDPN
jgi:hypothetical protein